MIFAFGRSRGFLGERGRNLTSTSNGIELALQLFDLLLDGDNLVELA